MLARNVCWWPKLNEDIESFIASCKQCQVSRCCERKDCYVSWPSTSSNWERIHLDFCSMYGQTYLIVFDVHTKWIEIFHMKTTTALDVIQVLRSTFARFGIPDTVVSDNGPPFSSNDFVTFLKSNSVKVMKSPVYHPESNGSAERSVQTAKHTLKHTLRSKSKLTEIQAALANFLFKYRNTPSTSTNQTPSEMMFRHKPRTLLEVLKPKRTEPISKRSTSKIFSFGDKVTVKWKPELAAIPARVLHILGHNTYLVNANNVVKMAHADQLRSSVLEDTEHPGLLILPSSTEHVVPEGEMNPSEQTTEATTHSPQSSTSAGPPKAVTRPSDQINIFKPPEPVLRRSERIRKAPVHYGITS